MLRPYNQPFRGMTLQLQAQNISKSFGATQALKDVHITLEAGKVHALVGENGAGKSTLFKICAGAIPKDTGEMMLDGVPYTPHDLRAAQRAGVALVFQEITINPSLTIAENIYIDRMYQFAGMFGLSRWKKLRAAAQQILDSIGAGISVTQNISQLDLGQYKVIEIARALAYQPKVLLLDESTAFLNTREMDALFTVVNNLRQHGIAVGYISHHLEEIEKIADSITILKDGCWVGSYNMGELTREQIEALMVGREIGRDIYPAARDVKPDNVVLQVSDLSVPGKLNKVDLTLYRGEVLGIGGLKGAGGETLLSVLNGDNGSRQGNLTFEDRPYAPNHPFEAWQQGIAYLPGDRTGEGLILDFSVRDNLSMAVMPRKGIFLDRSTETRLVERLMSTLQVKAASASVPCSSLSGGNLQKVVLGKCMAAEPKVLLLNNPTRGIDIGARMQIYGIIRELAGQGVSVILLTEDLAELIGMSDRIIVMRKGTISKAFSHADVPSEEEIVKYMI
jgi:ABC-type sugar transport system ATPase subunit